MIGTGRTNLHSKMHSAARLTSKGFSPPDCRFSPSSLQILSSSSSCSGASRLPSLTAPRLVLGHLDPGFSFGKVGCMRSRTPFSCVIAGGNPLQAYKTFRLVWHEQHPICERPQAGLGPSRHGTLFGRSACNQGTPSAVSSQEGIPWHDTAHLMWLVLLDMQGKLDCCLYAPAYAIVLIEILYHRTTVPPTCIF